MGCYLLIGLITKVLKMDQDKLDFHKLVLTTCTIKYFKVSLQPQFFELDNYKNLN